MQKTTRHKRTTDTSYKMPAVPNAPGALAFALSLDIKFVNT